MKFKNIDFNIFNKAIKIYLKNAYPNGIKEKSFCYKTIEKLNNSKNIKDIYNIFEKINLNIRGKIKKTKYVVRLGSEKYPFLKLVLQETPTGDRYGFLVDRHTEYLALNSSAKTFEEEIKMKEYTRELKHKIESEYAENNIPTYRSIVKELTKLLINKMSNHNIEKNGIKVLLVEDDEDILNLYKLNLEFLGYTVSTAVTGEEALYKVGHEFDHIMLLDLMLPTISGFEIIRRIADEIPIIVISSLSDKISKEKALRDGVKLFLTKPIEISEIDSIIRKILKKVE